MLPTFSFVFPASSRFSHRNLSKTLMVLLFGQAVACSSHGEDKEPVPTEYTFDTYNIGLAGSFVPWEEERRGPILEALAEMESDVVCLQEAWRRVDKDDIEQAVRNRFPHVVRFEHDFETPLDDPEDQDGKIPPESTTPPCGEPSTRALFDDTLECLVENCSTIPGSRDGKAVSATCAEEKCFLQAAPLLTGEQNRRCYGCAVTSLPVDTLGEIYQKCTTNPKAALAFDGQNGVMLLSRYPLANEEAWVLPGTWNRRVILRATAKLPNGMDLDVYCNHLTAVFFDLAFPYTGDYSGGLTGSEAWGAEQKLQAEKLIAYVSKHSGDRPAVVLGDFNAGYELREDGRIVMRAEGEETMRLLEEYYVEALTPDYQPACTFCASNPVTGLTKEWESAWVDHIFLNGIPRENVLSSVLTLDEHGIPVTSEAGELKVPLSDHYGMRATIEISP